MDSQTSIVRQFYHSTSSLIHSTDIRNRCTIIDTIKKNSAADIFCAWGQNSNLPIIEYTDRIVDFLGYAYKRHICLYAYDSKTAQKEKLKTIFPIHASKW